MNGENNGKPLLKLGWFGGKTPYFRKHPPLSKGKEDKRRLPSRGTNISQKCRFEDDFPLPQVGYVNSLEGIPYGSWFPEISNKPPTSFTPTRPPTITISTLSKTTWSKGKKKATSNSYPGTPVTPGPPAKRALRCETLAGEGFRWEMDAEPVDTHKLGLFPKMPDISRVK